MKYIEVNGASFTIDVNDIHYTKDEATRFLTDLIKSMELEKKDLIISGSVLKPRITLRVKGDTRKIESFFKAILENNKFCVRRNISLALS